MSTVHNPLELGTTIAVNPIPPVESDTHYIDAGTLVIGVEYRNLNEDLMAANYVDPVQAAIIAELTPPAILDRGVAIHVFERATHLEYLRFDLFEIDPHYHYIRPGTSNTLVRYDPGACGDMLDWACNCLQLRIVDMLVYAGADRVAASVDQRAVANAIPMIREHVARSTHSVESPRS